MMKDRRNRGKYLKSNYRNIFITLFFSLICQNIFSASSFEKSVCGIKEPLVFWLWKNAAGETDDSRVEGLEGIEEISFVTKDGRTLRGYKINADSKTPNGYLLVLLGNSMLADQLIGDFTDYAKNGVDVYIYDYRGYGLSEGKRRLKAIISDYKEIIRGLDAKPYENQYIYAMSFGGIVAINVLKENQGDKFVVIDSTPSRISVYGCPIAYDPVENVPRDASRYLIIAGGSDTIVKPRLSKELTEKLLKNGAVLYKNESLAHPFMDKSIEMHNLRLKKVKEFLIER